MRMSAEKGVKIFFSFSFTFITIKRFSRLAISTRKLNLSCQDHVHYKGVHPVLLIQGVHPVLLIRTPTTLSERILVIYISISALVFTNKNDHLLLLPFMSLELTTPFHHVRRYLHLTRSLLFIKTFIEKLLH